MSPLAPEQAWAILALIFMSFLAAPALLVKLLAELAYLQLAVTVPWFSIRWISPLVAT